MASWDDSRIAIPFVPSLHHLSSVKIAVRLFNQFNVLMLETAFTEIKQGNDASIFDCTPEWNLKKVRAKEELLAIPAHLRETVVRAVHGLGRATKDWKTHHYHRCKCHLDGLGCYPKEHFCYRSDGSIDAVKTAQNLVRDEKICVKKRFKIACIYCLEQSVRTLWGKMVASGIADSFYCKFQSLVRMYVRWLREGGNVPWRMAVKLYLDPPSRVYLTYGRFSVLLPLLPPEYRPTILQFLQGTSCDDLRFSLFALTKEEEETLLKENVTVLLILYLSWPLQTLFVETAEKLLSYIDQESFCYLLSYTLELNKTWNDFNYSEVIEYLWNRRPDNFREIVRKRPTLRDSIDSYFRSKKRKRSASNEIK